MEPGMWMPVMVEPRGEEVAESVLAWPVGPGWKSSQAGRPGEESEPYNL